MYTGIPKGRTKSQRSKAKATAWKWFSLYIRARDCIRTSGSLRYGACISCGKLVPFAEADAGHFVSGRKDNVLFVEDNVWLQCKACNRFKQGNVVHYEFALRRIIGPERVEELKRLVFTVKKYTSLEYRDLANEYREKYKKLKELY